MTSRKSDNRGNENFSWASFKVDCDKRLGQAVNHFPILCLAVISQDLAQESDAAVVQVSKPV